MNHLILIVFMCFPIIQISDWFVSFINNRDNKAINYVKENTLSIVLKKYSYPYVFFCKPNNQIVVAWFN